MNEIILLTDNLLKNILQKIRETKEDLQHQIADSARQLQVQIDQMKTDVRNTQRLLENSNIGAFQSPGSPYSNGSGQDYTNEFREIRGLQKKLTFDFHFLNERISQMQKINDTRLDGLKGQLSRFEELIKDQQEESERTDNILKETQEILEALNEATSKNSKKIDSLLQDVFKPIEPPVRDFYHGLTDRIDNDFKSGTALDFGFHGSMRGSLNLETQKRTTQPPTLQNSPQTIKDPFAAGNKPSPQQQEPQSHRSSLDPRDSILSKSKLTSDEVSFDVDEDGYLIDHDGNYVHGDDGQTIKLSPSEVQAFLSTKL